MRLNHFTLIDALDDELCDLGPLGEGDHVITQTSQDDDDLSPVPRIDDPG